MNDFLNRPVYSLQTMLRTISDTDTRILPVIPNGIYGPNTYASVRSFQQAYDLADTGSVNWETWNKIISVHNQVQKQRNTPVTIPVWEPSYIVSIGQYNAHVTLVQAMLIALSTRYPAFPKPALTGVLDIETAEGLRQVQRAAGIEDRGNLDTETWFYLNHLYRTVLRSGA